MFSVTLIACVEGNPHQAWHGSTGPEDEEHVPDDVWQDQVHDFRELEDAKEFIRGLHPEVTTHVELHDEDGEVIYRKDAGDDLDAAEPGVVPDSAGVEEDVEDVAPPAPPVMEAQ